MMVSPADDFINNRLHTYHPAFDGSSAAANVASGSNNCNDELVPLKTTSGHNAQPAFYEPNALIPGQNVAQENTVATKIRSFPEVIKEFQTIFPLEPKGRVEKGISIRSKTSWEEVLTVLHDAAAAYTTKTGMKQAFDKIKIFVENHADTFERATRLVPDVDYAKPVLGALTFLLHAFQQTSKVREEVKDGVEKLKKNFGLVEDYIEMYSTKQKVVDAVMALYVTILKAIEEVIGYYTKHIVIKGIKAVWNGENYEKSLLSCLENISKDGEELVNEADTAHKQVTNKIAKDIQTELHNSEDIKQNTEDIKALITDGLRGMFKQHMTEMEVKHEKEMQLLRSQIEQRDAERAKWEQLYYRAITPEPPSVVECIVTQEDLLHFLDLTDIEATDTEYIIHQRELIISGGRDRTEQIMKTSQLREWLVQAESKELLIHGNSDPQPISPISFFCAMLLQNLRGVDRFKSVAFFCGSHSYEDYGGARTMIMSLLAQLLRQQRFDLSFIDHDLAYRMDGGDIETFCYVFGRLVEQIKRTETVFCVIDGINFYECNEGELLQEMAYVLRFLLDWTKQRGAVFKILITSPSTTDDVRQAIEDKNYLALPQQAANTLGFSDLRFERQWQEDVKVE